jgi:hypothetical protein
MVIQQIPCIKDKCLKYPVCKYKLKILCSPLVKWYFYQEKIGLEILTPELRKYFPLLRQLDPEKSSDLKYTYTRVTKRNE